MSTKTQKSPEKGKQVDQLLEIARAATAVATRDGEIRFGAPVSRTQVHAVQEFIGKRSIPKFTGCTVKQLTAYARNEVSVAQLPDRTREALREVNGVYAKPWARKSAAILVALQGRKK